MPPQLLTDDEIFRLIAEPKPAVDARTLLASMKLTENQQLRAARDIVGDAGSELRLFVRQSALDRHDFSAVLSYLGRGRPINLIRCNGPTHPHRNVLEGVRVDFAPHIHTATERYQLAGHDAEHYAEPTTAYVDLGGALNELLRRGGFRPSAQGTMV